jgi:primosomal protein N' (replication factor Y)
MPLYADIILPVPLNQLFTYLVPETLIHTAVPGARVYVPFGKGRRLTGIIVRTHSVKPTAHTVRELLGVLDEQGPSILPSQLSLMEWMAGYCMCPPGDVMKAALPSGLRPDSSANDKPYKPRIEIFVKPGPNLPKETPLDLAELLGKTAVKQKEVLGRYLALAGYNENPQAPAPVSKKALTDGGKSSAAIRALLDNGLIDLYELETGRLPRFEGRTQEPPQLSPAQQNALDGIRQSFKSRNVCLLHGVTSSGKTEIYIHLIKEYLKRGRQVLYLLPEIALTTQIMHRLQKVFGDDMCVYHSRCSDNIRVEVWNRLTGPNPYKLILGARSAVMLPMQQLGLVIVDEEHEPSFKQEDPSPRYQGRNTAIMLASICGAKTLLGSATPALESYSNAVSGKYGLVTLTERFRGMRLPEIEIVDTAELRRKKYMKGIFSPQLTESIRQALQNGRQAILFHNRRGYAGTVECPDCGWVQKCDCCDVSLTFHKSADIASCHYCGHKYRVPLSCPSCGGRALRGRGFGTERIEEEVAATFPGARVARLDLDSAKEGYESIITDFQEGRTDILIGTQMVSKGLDFDNVSVVGILQADSIMSYPDFRATERAYQLMAQVAGRAGRRDTPGKVIIQTRQPDAPVLDMVRRNDYRGFYNIQMDERNAFRYPPYTRLISVTAKGTELQNVEQAAQALAGNLSELFGPQNVLGPDAPPVSRVQYMHIRRIIVKAALDMAPGQIRTQINEAARKAAAQNMPGGVTLYYDADPQ